MKFTTRALAFIFGVFVLTLSFQSFADEKKDAKEVAKDVKFACTRHGPNDMQLTLSLEKGDPRKIEINGTGNSNSQWSVIINGEDKTPANKGTVMVRSGDSITWNIAGGKHGVAFAEKNLAQAMLDFDLKAGKPLVDLTNIINTNAWKMFGTMRWGTEETDDKGVLVKCKVK